MRCCLMRDTPHVTCASSARAAAAPLASEDGIAVRCVGDRRLAVIFVHTATSSAEVNQLGEAVRSMLRGGVQSSGGKF